MANVQNSMIVVSATALIAVATLIFSVVLYKKRKTVKPPNKWKPVGKVTKLHLYPLKSGRRVEMNSAVISEYGMQQSETDEKALQLRDRSFIVYGEKNMEFKTARTFPKMVLIEVSVHDENHVAFDAPGMRSLYVKLPTIESTEEKIVKVHDGEGVFMLDCGDEAASWISRYIYGNNDGARIGYHDGKSNHIRPLTTPTFKRMTQIHTNLGDQSAGLYSDLTAFLLVNQASVDDLNTRIKTDTVVTSENFRPTITIEGEEAPAYAEDDYDWIKIGDTILHNVKPCTRCVMTTINPETGIKNSDMEPLSTLKTYRQLKEIKDIDYEGKSPVMGIHLEVNKTGTIQVNDIVYIGSS